MGVYQKAYSSYDKTILQLGGRRMCPRKSSAKVYTQRRQKGREANRRFDVKQINPTYSPFRLQHLVLTQTQRLLEEYRYNEMANVTSTLNGGGLDSLASITKIALLPENYLSLTTATNKLVYAKQWCLPDSLLPMKQNCMMSSSFGRYRSCQGQRSSLL